MTLRVKCDGCGKEGSGEEIPRDFSSDKDLCQDCLRKAELTEMTEKRSTLAAARARMDHEIGQIDTRINELQSKVSDVVQP